MYDPSRASHKHHQVRAHRGRDVDGALGAVDGPTARLGAIRGEAPVDAAGIFPQSRRDELRHQPFPLEDLLELFRFAFHFRGRLAVDVGHRVIVVQLHTLETQLLVRCQFLGKLDRGAYRRSKRIGAFADVPRPKRKTVVVRHLSNLLTRNKIQFVACLSRIGPDQGQTC